MQVVCYEAIFTMFSLQCVFTFWGLPSSFREALNHDLFQVLFIHSSFYSFFLGGGVAIDKCYGLLLQDYVSDFF